jgi:hypothetical protein
MHKGNSAKDTHGCILVGNNDNVGWVNNFAKYNQKIVDLIKQYREMLGDGYLGIGQRNQSKK